MKRKRKSVVDTGILISAFAFGGIPRQAVIKSLRETVIYVSPDILNEYKEIPARLLKTNKIDIKQFNALIYGIATFVSEAETVFPSESINICRDPEDNMLLECCKEARTDYLITGDRDLLALKDLTFKL